jgi:signal transduction histidine kinase
MVRLRHPDADRESASRTESAPSEVEPLETPLSLIARDRVFKVRRNGLSVEIDLHRPGGPVAAPGANLVFPGSYREALRKLDLAFKSGEVQHVAFRQVVDGEARDYHATLVPAFPGEARAFVRDISSHRGLEQRLLHTERMAAIGHILGGITHDFNNILTAILAYCQVAVHESTSAGTAGNAANVQTAAERGVGLCRRLLRLSRIQSDAAQELDLDEVVIDVTPLLGTVLSENIELVTRTEPGLGLVRVNPGQIEQAIVSLAINANDTMPHGGKLTIATSRIAVDQTSFGDEGRVPQGEYVVLSVGDTGDGIPEMDESRLDSSP